jgi:hypothetical protein
MACAMVQLSSGNCDCFQTLFLLHEKTIPCIACTDIWFDISLYSFDQFHIIRQGLLLSIDTFGVSNILPVLSLPFIALVWCNIGSKDNKAKGSIINSLTQVHKVKENSIFSSECWRCTTTKYTFCIEYYLFYAELKYTSTNTGPYWIID